MERIKTALTKAGIVKKRPVREDGEMDSLDRLRQSLADRYTIERDDSGAVVASVLDQAGNQTRAIKR